MDLTLSLINSLSFAHDIILIMAVLKVWLQKVKSVNSRLRSLYIVHLSMLIVALGASIIFTGVWPYIQEVRAKSKGFFIVVPCRKVPRKCAQIFDSIRLQALSCIHMCSKTNSLGLFIVSFRLLQSR